MDKTNTLHLFPMSLKDLLLQCLCTSLANVFLRFVAGSEAAVVFYSTASHQPSLASVLAVLHSSGRLLSLFTFCFLLYAMASVITC